MFKAYLLSLFIWMVIILFTTLITSRKIIQNGWVEGTEPATFSHSVVTLILVAATPILRVIVCAGMFCMAMETKEHFEEKLKDEDDE